MVQRTRGAVQVSAGKAGRAAMLNLVITIFPISVTAGPERREDNWEAVWLESETSNKDCLQ